MRAGRDAQAAFDWCAPGLVAGVDEAGRGPLAGPVVAAAVILDPARPIPGITDSKALSAARRAAVAVQIRAQSLAWGLGWADAGEVDALNVLQATFLAMRRALQALQTAPAHVIVDGDRCPCVTGLPFECTVEAIVKGDARVECIGAASILAKTARDEYMVAADRLYPGYGFAGHKGYGTAAHLASLRRLGPCPLHRRSYAPVESLIVP
jgi:ribonuclease HII